MTNNGTITLLSKYISPLAKMRHDARVETWEAKVKAGVKKPKPVEPAKGKPTWRITTKPHIGMQMKRLFPGLVGTPAEMYYAHTPENARNLEWFMMRYPMRVDPARDLFDTAAAHKVREKVVADLMAGRIKATTATTSIHLVRPLWDQQVIGVELGYQRRHLLIADEVGEGKTAQAIALMARIPGLKVVVTLTHLPRQWRHAIDEWTSEGMTTHVVTEGTPYDVTRRKVRGRKPATPGKMPDVILISFSKLAGWANWLNEKGVVMVTYDEVQEFRTGTESAKWDAGYVLSTAAEWVLGLSATPFYGYGAEFWNVGELVSPGELGTQEEFEATWCVTREGKKVIADTDAFGSYLYETGLMIRRCRPKQEPQKIIQWVDSDGEAIGKVAPNLAELARAILREEKETNRGAKMRASGEFDMRMRQACGIDKAPHVAEFVKLLLETEKRVVIFAHHREVYKILREALKEFNPVEYTGEESQVEKDLAMIHFAGAPSGSPKERYVGGKSRVFMVANRSGAGIDGLQYVCRIAVIAEFDWAHGILKQNIGRVDREGQEKTVLAYLMMSDTVADKKLATVNGIKRQQIEGVLMPNRGLVEDLQRDTGHIREMAREYLESRGLTI